MIFFFQQIHCSDSAKKVGGDFQPDEDKIFYSEEMLRIFIKYNGHFERKIRLKRKHLEMY